VKEWHIPHMAALPIPPRVFFLSEPDDEQETSYFADSVNILMVFSSSISHPTEQMFYFVKTLYTARSRLSSEMAK